METESPKFLIKTGSKAALIVFKTALIISGANPTGSKAIFRRFSIDFTNLTAFIKLSIDFNGLILGVTLAGSGAVLIGFKTALTGLKTVIINLGTGLIITTQTLGIEYRDSNKPIGR